MPETPVNTQLLQDILNELRHPKSNTVPLREIMDVAQAAEYLGQSEYTLREWIRMRKIPYCKINGSIKFRKSKLDRWMDLNEIPGR